VLIWQSRKTQVVEEQPENEVTTPQAELPANAPMPAGVEEGGEEAGEQAA